MENLFIGESMNFIKRLYYDYKYRHLGLYKEQNENNSTGIIEYELRLSGDVFVYFAKRIEDKTFVLCYIDDVLCSIEPKRIL